MHQHNSATFQNSYLSRYITADTQAVYRGLPPQVEVMRMASGMSRTIDRDRPWRADKQIMAACKKDPHVVLQYRAKEGLKKTIKAQYQTVARSRGEPIYKTYQTALRRYTATKKSRLRVHIDKARELYNKNQPVLEIERQLSGVATKASGAAAAAPPQSYRIAERKNAVDALLAFASVGTQAARSRAITALARLAVKREGVTGGRRRGSYGGQEEEMDIGDGVGHISSIPIKCEPTQCIFCLGDEDIDPKVRARPYYRRHDLKKHWRGKHIPGIKVPIVCPHPSCDKVLTSEERLRNHAHTIHGTPV